MINGSVTLPFDFFTKAGMDAVQRVFALGQNRFDSVNKGADEAAAFQRETVEAIVASATAVAEGVEEITEEMVNFGKSQVDQSLAAIKTFLTVRTPDEFFATQSAFAQATLDACLAQTTKMGEISARLAQETAEPINNRLHVAIDKLVRPLSA